MRSVIFLASILALAQVQQALGQVCENVYPHLSCGITHTEQSSCESSGCCWDGDAADGVNCFAPKIYGYAYTLKAEEPGVSHGSLSLNAPSGINFGADFSELSIDITQETESRTHIKMSPVGETRWEVPESILPRPGGVYTGVDALMKTTVKPQNDDDEYDNMEILITRQTNNISTELLFAFTKMVIITFTNYSLLLYFS
jgi:hypothetical protein